MAHKFGDLLQKYLQDKKLKQKDMATAINVDPALVSRMVGGYLGFQGAREIVVKMLVWLHEQQAIDHLDDANALLEAAGMEGLSADQTREAGLLSSLSRLQPSTVSARDTKRHLDIAGVSAPDQTRNEPTRSPMPAVTPSALRGYRAILIPIIVLGLGLLGVFFGWRAWSGSDTDDCRTTNGAILYEDAEFKGKKVSFSKNTADLRDALINDSASSLRICGTYTLTLYRDINYRGEAEVFTQDDRDLRDNAVGNDQASSLQIVRRNP